MKLMQEPTNLKKLQSTTEDAVYKCNRKDKITKNKLNKKCLRSIVRKIQNALRIIRKARLNGKTNCSSIIKNCSIYNIIKNFL